MQKRNLHYSYKLEQFNKFSKRLNKIIDNGTFYRLSFEKRNMLIRRIRRLYEQLSGIIPEFKLKHILAAAAFFVLSFGAGNAVAQSFAPPQLNPFGLISPITYSTYSDFVDIDGDGDLDVFAGITDNCLIYYENTGTSTAPAFAASQINPFGLGGGYLTSAPAFVDIDADGDLDAFIGSGGYYPDPNRRIYFFENTSL